MKILVRRQSATVVAKFAVDTLHEHDSAPTEDINEWNL